MLPVARSGASSASCPGPGGPHVGRLHFLRNGQFAGFDQARIYAQLGDKARAFAALDHAWQVRNSNLLDLKTDPYLDPLRGDPRYASLVEALGLHA